jgi:hypothetical protein
MADTTGQRMARNQGEQAAQTPSREKFSELALQYIDQVPVLQRAAENDEYLNGTDAVRRLRGATGG